MKLPLDFHQPPAGSVEMRSNRERVAWHDSSIEPSTEWPGGLEDGSDRCPPKPHPTPEAESRVRRIPWDSRDTTESPVAHEPEVRIASSQSTKPTKATRTRKMESAARPGNQLRFFIFSLPWVMHSGFNHSSVCRRNLSRLSGRPSAQDPFRSPSPAGRAPTGQRHVHSQIEHLGVEKVAQNPVPTAQSTRPKPQEIRPLRLTQTSARSAQERNNADSRFRTGSEVRIPAISTNTPPINTNQSTKPTALHCDRECLESARESTPRTSRLPQEIRATGGLSGLLDPRGECS